MARGLEKSIRAVTTNCLNRAASQSFFAKLHFFIILRLLKQEGMATVVVALEVGRSGLTAEITVDALIVHIVSTVHVLGVFVCCVSHCLEGSRG